MWRSSGSARGSLCVLPPTGDCGALRQAEKVSSVVFQRPLQSSKRIDAGRPGSVGAFGRRWAYPWAIRRSCSKESMTMGQR